MAGGTGLYSNTGPLSSVQVLVIVIEIRFREVNLLGLFQSLPLQWGRLTYETKFRGFALATN